MVEDFGNAASRAQMAGFAVMIHMAHGYLINQFLSPQSNRRQDCYGGDLEGRSLLAVEILRKTRQRVGGDFPITCRPCGDNYIRGGFDLKQSKVLARKLEENGIDAIDVSVGGPEGLYWGPAPSYEEAASFGTRRTFLLESERQFRFFDRAWNQDKNYSRACQKADSFLTLIDSPNVLEKDIVVDEGGPSRDFGRNFRNIKKTSPLP